MSDNSANIFEREIKGKNKQIYDISAIIGPLGDFHKLSGIDVVIESIKNLLHTPLGSYPFDPNYGSLLYKKVFEPADEFSKEDIEYEIFTRVARYEDRAKLKKINTYYSVENKAFVVDILLELDGVEGTVRVDPRNKEGIFGLRSVGDE